MPGVFWIVRTLQKQMSPIPRNKCLLIQYLLYTSTDIHLNFTQMTTNKCPKKPLNQKLFEWSPLVNSLEDYVTLDLIWFEEADDKYCFFQIRKRNSWCLLLSTSYTIVPKLQRTVRSFVISEQRRGLLHFLIAMTWKSLCRQSWQLLTFCQMTRRGYWKQKAGYVRFRQQNSFLAEKRKSITGSQSNLKNDFYNSISPAEIEFFLNGLFCYSSVVIAWILLELRDPGYLDFRGVRYWFGPGAMLEKWQKWLLSDEMSPSLV